MGAEKEAAIHAIKWRIDQFGKRITIAEGQVSHPRIEIEHKQRLFDNAWAKLNTSDAKENMCR